MKFKLNAINLLNGVGALVIIYLVVILGQTVKRNYDLDHQVGELKSQITSLQDQKDELTYNIQYYRTDSFQEREARAKLGLQLPGENVVILPPPSPAPKPAQTQAKPTQQKSNMRQWLDFLAGRG